MFYRSRFCLAALVVWSFVAIEVSTSQEQAGRADEKQDVSFTAKHDGSEQRYVLVYPEGFASKPASPITVVIALHGHGSDRWQFVKQARDECRATRDVAAKYGCLLVSPDYRAKTSWMGPAAEADVLQIIQNLHSQFKIKQVVLCGGSMGGTAALTFAALHPDLIDGVVAMNGTANLVEYTQFQDAISASFGGTKQEKPDEYRKRSAELHVTKLTMPIGLTTGGQDKSVPPDSVIRLADRLASQKSPVKLIHRAAGGHETNYTDAMAAFEYVFDQLGLSRGDHPSTSRSPDKVLSKP